MSSLAERVVARYLAAAGLTDNVARGRILGALTEAFKRDGFDGLMRKAYEIEAGAHPFDRIDNRKMWLSDLLRELGRTIEHELSKSELSRLHMYRDDLRR